MLIPGFLLFLVSLVLYRFRADSTDFENIAALLPLPVWTQSPQDILAEARAIISRDVAFYDQIAEVKEPAVDNVLIPTLEYENAAHFPETKLTFYQYVFPDKAVRDASTEAETLLDQNAIELSLRVDVFEVYNELYEKIKGTNATDPESMKLLEKTVRFFKRNGLGLPEEEREKVKLLKIRLADLQTQFAKNTNEENGCLTLSLEELEGVPDSVIDQFEKTIEDGVEKLQVTFKYPDILPVLKYAKKQDIRKLAYFENLNKVPENVPILKEIIEIRFSLAKLLGYNTYADFVLEERLAKNPANVLAFLGDLKDKLTPVGRQELQTLKEFKKAYLLEHGLLPQDEYFAWDHAFFNNLFLEQELEVDHQGISEYFPLERTISKMMSFYETLFDVKFVGVENSDPLSVWHHDV